MRWHLEINAEKNIVILLGSGASIDYFPGTAELTQSLLSWEKYREPPSNEKKFNKWLDQLGEKAGQGRGYFKALVEELGLKEGDYNFENLIYISNELDNSLWSRLTSKSYLKNAFLKNSSHYPYNSYISFQAKNYILNSISPKKNTTAPEQSQFVKFLNVLNNKSVNVKIFSLNYDTLPLYSCINFDTGFESYHEHYGLFSSEALLRHTPNLFCQLHGSIDFGFGEYFDPLRGEPRSVFARYYNKPHLAAASREELTFLPVGNEDGTIRSTNNFIITGLRKSDEILNSPYLQFYFKFYQELIASENWLYIGYGESDEHINSLVRAAASFHHGKIYNKSRLQIAKICKGRQKSRGILYFPCALTHMETAWQCRYRGIEGVALGENHLGDKGFLSFKGIDSTLEHHATDLMAFFGFS